MGKKSSIGNRFFIHDGIEWAVRTVGFVSDRMSYRFLRGRWCNIIFL
jgi:hypothetical protein